MTTPTITTNKNLRRNTTNEYYFKDQDEEFYVIGDRVLVDGNRPASVAYFGEIDFGPIGLDWVGVVLDEPTGQHDGKYHGREYFQCAQDHGLFVRPNRVRRLYDSALGSSATSSRSATPYERSSSSTGRSTASSGYYYDEDYRKSHQPSAESLSRKLKNIDSSSKYFLQDSKMPQGILKRGSYEAPHNVSSSLSSRVGELSRRLQEANSPTVGRAESVFNFRPRRERLDEQDYATNERLGARRRSVSLSPYREPLRKGDRVKVRLLNNHVRETQLTGVLRFMGETLFATGEWAGVELDEPAGKNDGSVLGHRYFYCPKDYGIFVPATRVRRLTDDEGDGDMQTIVDQFENRLQNFGTMRSTIKSPPPTKSSHSRVATSRRDGSLQYSPTLSATSRSTTPSHENQSPFSSSSYSASPVHRDHFYRSPSLRAGTPMSSSSSIYADDGSAIRSQYSLKDTVVPPVRSSSYDYSSRVKFDDRDIEKELQKSLSRQQSPATATDYRRQVVRSKPKAVTYTFISSKYDGNPIARRTLLYE